MDYSPKGDINIVDSGISCSDVDCSDVECCVVEWGQRGVQDIVVGCWWSYSACPAGWVQRERVYSVLPGCMCISSYQ